MSVTAMFRKTRARLLWHGATSAAIGHVGGRGRSCKQGLILWRSGAVPIPAADGVLRHRLLRGHACFFRKDSEFVKRRKHPLSSALA